MSEHHERVVAFIDRVNTYMPPWARPLCRITREAPVIHSLVAAILDEVDDLERRIVARFEPNAA